MAQSPDHPELVFLEALQTDGSPAYTRGRPDGPPLWVVIHDMEAHELATTAEATAQYFHTGAGGRQVSSHYTADNNSVVQCVLLRDSAWTVGNRPGNRRGINWELAGFASQTRAQWLDEFGRAMFGQIAPLIRSDAARYGIPLRRATIADLQAYRPGVTSHNDLRVAFNVTDHTDPGPNFPWDVFMALLNNVDPAPAEEDEHMSVIFVKSTEDPANVWVSNFVTRRAIPTNRPDLLAEAGWWASGWGGSSGNDWSNSVGRVVALGPTSGTAPHVTIYPVSRLDAFGVPVPWAGGTAPGGGATPEQVREIVDEELDEAFSGAADND